MVQDQPPHFLADWRQGQQLPRRNRRPEEDVLHGKIHTQSQMLTNAAPLHRHNQTAMEHQNILVKSGTLWNFWQM